MPASFSMGFSRCPAQLVDPFLQITQHGSFVAVIPQAREALLQQVGFENAPVQSKQGVQLTPLAAVQIEPTAQKQPALPPYQISRSSSFAEDFSLRIPAEADQRSGVMSITIP